MHTSSIRALCLASCVALSAGAAKATPFTVYGTGVDNSNTLLAAGTADPHYSVIYNGTSAEGAFKSLYTSNFSGATAAYTPGGAGSYPEGPNGPNGGIAYQAANYLPAPVATWTFRTTFSLAGYLANTASLTLSYFGDDDVAIFLNGTFVSGSELDRVYTPTAFTINSGFVSGTNTLDFITYNAGGAEGIWVGDITDSATYVPEPMSVALLGGGVAILAGARMRGCRG